MPQVSKNDFVNDKPMEMNLTSPADVRNLLATLNLVPSKAMGQNFLIDRNIRDGIVREAGICGGETVLEIGPGLGVLTEAMIEAGANVLAVEKDKRLCDHLRKRFGGLSSFRLVCADMLSLEVDGVLAERDGWRRVARMVSNLPYSVGNRILVDVVDSDLRPECIVVTVQKEVADRFTAANGSKDFSKLSLWIQLDYTVEKIKTISRTCFWPPPDVESVVVRMTRRSGEEVTRAARAAFRSFTTTAFAQRRKKVGPVLGRARGPGGREIGPGLEVAGIDPHLRPEDIILERWISLARWYAHRS